MSKEAEVLQKGEPKLPAWMEQEGEGTLSCCMNWNVSYRRVFIFNWAILVKKLTSKQKNSTNDSLMVELEAMGYLGSKTCLQLGSMSFFLFP